MVKVFSIYRQRRFKAVTLALSLLLFTCAISFTSVVNAQQGASPCPDDAPLRTFDVSAIAVDIVYNNFGDIDLASGSNTTGDNPGHPARANLFALEKQSYTGSTGPNGKNEYNSSDLIRSAVTAHGNTPAYEVQPLTIRCNVGDCININLTNKDLNFASLTIRRAQYNVLDSEGNIVGDNSGPAALNKGETHTYVFYIDDQPENQGAYHISSQADGFIDLAYGGLWGSLVAEPKGSKFLASTNPWSSNSEGVHISGFDRANPPDLTWSDWEAIVVPCQGVAKGTSPSCDRIFNSIGAFDNGVSENGELGIGTGPTTNPQGSFREAVTYYHDGIFMADGKLNQPDRDMKFPVRDPNLPNPEGEAEGEGETEGGILLPIKGEQLDSGLWGLPDGGSVHGERYAFTTHAGILGTRGWPMMGTPGPVDSKQPQNNNTSFNDDEFKSVDAHNTNFGKGLNYRSDPFSYMKAIEEDESMAYGSYAFAEPSTPCPRAYLGDPMIWRIVHGGGEEHHIQHMHGFTRWPEQPYEDHTVSPLSGEAVTVDGEAVLGSKMYMRGLLSVPGKFTESLERSAALLKQRKDTRPTASNIVDVTMIAPGEVYDLEFECGAGSCHGAPADWVDHCHVADHYTIGMWRFMRVYGTQQSNLSMLPGRPVVPTAVNSLDLIARGQTMDGKKFCSKSTSESCPDVENEEFVNFDSWVKHLLPSRGVQRQGALDPRFGGDGDAEWRNPAYDPFDANRNGIAQDIDGDGACLDGDPDALDGATIDSDGKVVKADGTTIVESCSDGGDPVDWIINPSCKSLDGSYDPNSEYGNMSMDGLRALTCIINGYDGDHLDWRLVETDDGPLVLNQPDGPLFQNFVAGIGDPQGRWSRYRDSVMYDLNSDGSVNELGQIGPRPGARAEMMFNPDNGRLDYPALRPLRGMRVPWPPNNHSGAPSTGETSTLSGITQLDSRDEAVQAVLGAKKSELGKYPDGLCPPNAPIRSYDIVAFPALELSGKSFGGVRGLVYNRFGDTDPNATVYALRNDEVDVYGAKRRGQQLAIRCNVGDCVDIQFRSHATDFNPGQDNFSKLNMHIHMVHFDPTASDGVIVGYNWEQSARPCTDIGQVTDLVSAAKDLNSVELGGDKAIGLAKEMQYTQDGLPALGGGEGPTHNILTPDGATGVERAANALNWNGRPWEYTHYRWFADIQMMAFWHPHLGGFLAFPLGVTNGTICEPIGSEYRDRVTGLEKYTHTDKVSQNPILGHFRNDTSVIPESGTDGGFPFADELGSTQSGTVEFGGNPLLGWALGDLDFEEQTKVINISANQEVDGCVGNNGRPCGNRAPQTGEDIPLFGQSDYRGGPSGLEPDDCGGISQKSTSLALADPSVTLTNDVVLKHVNGECDGINSDDSNLGALTGLARVSGELVPVSNSTLRTDRIFNRTNSEFDVAANGFETLSDSGGTEMADIITTTTNDLNAKAAPSFREAVFFWTDDIYLMLGNGTSEEPFDNRIEATQGVSGISLRNEPLDRRLTLGGLEQHKVFTSAPGVGDPSTPMMMAHPGDRYVIRSLMGGTQDMHAFRFMGQRFGNERANATSNPIDTSQNAIGYFQSYELMGGAGASFIDDKGKQHNMPGDYLYYMTIGAIDLASGSWGLLRVDEDLEIQPLDDTPDVEVGGDPCEGKKTRSYDVTAISVANNKKVDEAQSIFVLADKKGKPNKDAVRAAQPLVMRAVSGECVEVTLHAHQLDDPTRRVGITSGLVVANPKTSSGLNIGKNLEKGGVDQTVGSAANNPGTSVTYKWNTDKQTIYDLTRPAVGNKGGAKSWQGTISGTQEKEIGTVYLSSLVDPVKDLNEGLFGALIVEPEGSSWKVKKDDKKVTGYVAADVKSPEGDFREFVFIMHEESRLFASSFRPQRNFGGALNYRRSSTGPPFEDVDPGLIFTAEAGTPTRVRLIYANGSEDRVFTIHGHRWLLETGTEHSNSLSAVPMNVGFRYDLELLGNDTNGDGIADPGVSKFRGDYFVGAAELRSSKDGQWGVIRVE